MPSPAVESIFSQIQGLPVHDQLALAEAVDRLTWSHRWSNICARIEKSLGARPLPSDAEIDAEVRSVARSARYPSDPQHVERTLPVVRSRSE